ncbi:hypothetical protein AVEN_123093-1 [Araneus ventricosus]|uniref:Uncharacterized protein n=1 Tax=Araneus ventricosus TaxID=182803 RepID=A0A4Y2TFM0_ARAVE|nr:hypothetical protein AVEN_123093-1 [Araneus ventricosus]
MGKEQTLDPSINASQSPVKERVFLKALEYVLVFRFDLEVSKEADIRTRPKTGCKFFVFIEKPTAFRSLRAFRRSLNSQVYRRL